MLAEQHDEWVKGRRYLTFCNHPKTQALPTAHVLEAEACTTPTRMTSILTADGTQPYPEVGVNGMETANLLLRMNDCAGDSPHGSHELFGSICSYPVTHAFAMGSVQLGAPSASPKGLAYCLTIYLTEFPFSLRHYTRWTGNPRALQFTSSSGYNANTLSPYRTKKCLTT